MADGEIEVSVRAEGVDEAAGELGADGDRPSMGRQRDSGRMDMGKLLAKIAGLLVFLGPILDILGVVSSVLTAFVAPLAVTLLRLLTPLLRGLLLILPLWTALFERINDGLDLIFNPLQLLLGIVQLIARGVDAAEGLLDRVSDRVSGVSDRIDDAISTVRGLPARIGSAVPSLEVVESALTTSRDILSRVEDGISDAESRIGDLLKSLQELPQNIASALPSLGGGDVIDRGREFLSRGDDGRGERRGDTNIQIAGGLETFIDRVVRNGSVDFP